MREFYNPLSATVLTGTTAQTVRAHLGADAITVSLSGREFPLYTEQTVRSLDLSETPDRPGHEPVRYLNVSAAAKRLGIVHEKVNQFVTPTAVLWKSADRVGSGYQAFSLGGTVDLYEEAAVDAAVPSVAKHRAETAARIERNKEFTALGGLPPGKCCREGCEKPRRQRKKGRGAGTFDTYCDEHQREFGRAASARKASKGGPCRTQGCPNQRRKYKSGRFDVSYCKECVAGHLLKQVTTPGPCYTKGCNEPKAPAGSPGKFNMLCEEHQRQETWRKGHSPGKCARSECSKPKHLYRESGWYDPHCAEHKDQYLANLRERRATDPEYRFLVNMKEAARGARKKLADIEAAARSDR